MYVLFIILIMIGAVWKYVLKLHFYKINFNFPRSNFLLLDLKQ